MRGFPVGRSSLGADQYFIARPQTVVLLAVFYSTLLGLCSASPMHFHPSGFDVVVKVRFKQPQRDASVESHFKPPPSVFGIQFVKVTFQCVFFSVQNCLKIYVATIWIYPKKNGFSLAVRTRTKPNLQGFSCVLL